MDLARDTVTQESGAAMENAKRLEIENQLKSELDKAHIEYAFASARFDSLVTDLPDFPQPDGTLTIQQAGRASRAALAAYVAALRRYSDSTDNGIMPKDAPPE